jgi:hypothetical protein
MQREERPIKVARRRKKYARSQHYTVQQNAEISYYGSNDVCKK